MLHGLFNAPSGALAMAILLPLIGILPHLVLPAKNTNDRKLQAKVALTFYWVYGAFLTWLGAAGFGFSETLLAKGQGMPLGVTSLFIEPTLYLDGRNASFILLMGLGIPLVFTWLRDQKGYFSPSYYISANILLLSLAGVFLSESLLLFYLFWETALIGAYFWIGMHGRASVQSGEVYPALIRFCMFTLLGSLPMLVSIIALCAIAGKDPGIGGIASLLNELPESQRHRIFFGFAIGFAVKLPLLGFHGWLKDTYNVAPAACRAVLSGLMSKMGAYGLILILAQCFPKECLHYSHAFQILCVAGAIYGGLLCLAQDRLVDILIYSSLSHLSLIGLGVFTAVGRSEMESTGITGALFQVFNHGLIMIALFAFDARISDSGESPALSTGGGLRGGQRRLAALMLTAMFASLSLPGLSNFAGEILVFFSAFTVSPYLTFGASLGALITGGAIIRAFHKIFLGKHKGPPMSIFKQAKDFSKRESILALALILVWVVLGVYPMLYIAPVEKAILNLGAARSLAGLP